MFVLAKQSVPVGQSAAYSPTSLILAAVGLGAVIAGGYTAWYIHKGIRDSNIPTKWRRVGTVHTINIFPVKSCASLKIEPEDEVYCDNIGFLYKGFRDRMFMLIDENYKMVTARGYPTTVLIETRIVGPTTVALDAPGMETLELNYEDMEQLTVEVDTKVWTTGMKVRMCGEKYDQWFSKFLIEKDHGLHLVYYRSDKRVREVIWRMRKWSHINKDDRGNFNDATSYMLMSLSSVKELNTRLSKVVEPLQFRGSFDIELDDHNPFCEDYWKWIKMDDAIFRVFGPCTRCIFPNINPHTGKRDSDCEPYKTLKSYRQFPPAKFPAIGIHLGIRKPGFIKMGSIVYIDDQ